MPYLTKDKEAHYRELGLLHKKLIFSEVTMSTAKKSNHTITRKHESFN